MKCREIQGKLSAFLDGELSEKEASRIAKHLSGCQKCQREAASLSSVWDQLGEIREVDPSPYFWTRLDARITQAEEQHFSLGKVWVGLNRLLLPATAIAASVIGLWIGGAIYDVHQGKQPEAWEQVATSLYLDVLDAFPSQSIGSTYVELVSDQVQ